MWQIKEILAVLDNELENEANFHLTAITIILVQEAQPQSVYFPNPDRTVVSDNPSLAGMSFSERLLKPFFVVKQLTDFTITGSGWTKHKN